MSFCENILRCNITRRKLLYYNYIVICLFIVSYFGIITRFSQTTSYYDILKKEKRKISEIRTTSKPSNFKQKPDHLMKYILLWTDPGNNPFLYFGEGNSRFVKNSCEWINCYFTGDRNFLGDGAYTKFEVIVFNGPEMPAVILSNDLPKKRQFHQKYVYATIESAANYPFRDESLNGFFNWTWTYKLNSDARWGYIIVRDANNSVIGPREHMHWMDIADMDPIDKDFKMRLRSKKKAAAWMCSNCVTSSRREYYVKAFKQQLRKYNLTVDVYGDCGDRLCPKKDMPQCLRMLQKDYYFYLAFENSFSDDYVSEKILHALNSDTIPVVYGGANNSRFLPKGIYLDAFKLGSKKLAKTMFEIINNRSMFHRFFRWKKYYSFHTIQDSPETDSYCQFCAMINNDTLMNKHKTYDKFNAWWMYKVNKVI